MIGQKFDVKNARLYECGLCGNPYPYMCKECNMDIANAIIEVTAKDMGLKMPEVSNNKPEKKREERIFVGTGDLIPMWEMGCAHEDCCDCH